jgi:serine phosphatase RsbU (regulator of sigma subunit)
VIEAAAEAGDERLRRIVALTDAALSHLDVEDLYRELLDRVRTMIGADTAAIQLLDHDAEQLVTVATIGLEEEVRQGFRVDVGAGFGGRVATTRAPLIVDNVDATTVASPILRDAGVVSLVGVPMFAGGDLVGVLQLGSFRHREFSEQDLALLQLVADRAGLATQAQQSQADRAATLALQRSLMPTRLPRVNGIDMAARYVPGHHLGVGGDWYDVFVLPSGHLGVVVGDVAGHGLRAAVVMGRLRSALRAYALDWENPADVLTRLDRKIRHFESGNLATVLYAMISPAGDQMRVSLAGHLPPIVAAPGEPARPLRLPVDVPVGVGHTKTRQSATIALPERALVVFYTDGLVERRADTIDSGLRRLCGAIVPGPAEEVCAGVMARMDLNKAEDDVALLAVSRTG